MESRGIVYIAIGKDAVDMAVSSARSVISTGIEIPSITIFCDRDYGYSNRSISFISLNPFLWIQFKDPSCLVAYTKTQLHKLSPYDKTLYLDNDIQGFKDISSIWDYVGDGIGFSLAFCPLIEFYRYDQYSEESYTANIISNWRQYNSGMFLFTKNKLIFNFFENWACEWMRFQYHENMPLTRLLNSDASIVTELPSKFNDFYPDRNDKSVLVHYISWYKKYL